MCGVSHNQKKTAFNVLDKNSVSAKGPLSIFTINNFTTDDSFNVILKRDFDRF